MVSQRKPLRAASGDDRPRSLQRSCCGEQQSQWTRAEHDNGISRGNGTCIYSVKRESQRLGAGFRGAGRLCFQEIQDRSHNALRHKTVLILRAAEIEPDVSNADIYTVALQTQL